MATYRDGQTYVDPNGQKFKLVARIDPRAEDANAYWIIRYLDAVNNTGLASLSDQASDYEKMSVGKMATVTEDSLADDHELTKEAPGA